MCSTEPLKNYDQCLDARISGETPRNPGESLHDGCLQRTLQKEEHVSAQNTTLYQPIHAYSESARDGVRLRAGEFNNYV